MAKYNAYVDDDLIVTAMLFSGMTQEEVQDRIRRNGGNVRRAFETMKSPANEESQKRTNKRHDLIQDYLDHLGTGNLEKLMIEGAGLSKDDVKAAIYWAQREVGGVATPTLDRVLYFFGGAEGRAKSKSSWDFAARVRPGLQTLGRGDTALSTTRTQYKTGQKPAPAPPPGQPAPAGPPAPAGAPPAPGGFEMDTGGAGKFQYRGTVVPAEPVKKAPGKVPVTQGTGGGGGDNTAPPVDDTPKIPPLARGATFDQFAQHIRQYYGYAAWAIDIPEVAQILREMAETPGGWTQEAVTGRISGTEWWKSNGLNVQTWLQAKANDPHGTQEKIKGRFDEFRSAAQAAGIEVPEQRLWDMAEESLKWNWSEQTIQAVIGAEYRYDPSKPTATTIDIKQRAAEYLVPMGDATMQTWTKQILTGEKTEEDLQNYLIQTASSMFPHLAAPLQRGEKLTQYIDGYKQHAARVLEVDADTIDFTDPKWMRVLSQADPKTGERRVMDIADMDKLIRTDPTYGYEYTTGAKNEATSLYSSISRKMGFS